MRCNGKPSENTKRQDDVKSTEEADPFLKQYRHSPSRSRVESPTSLGEKLERASRIRRNIDSLNAADDHEDDKVGDEDIKRRKLTPVFHVSLLGNGKIASSTSKKQLIINSSPTLHSKVLVPSLPVKWIPKEDNANGSNIFYVKESFQKLDPSQGQLNELHRPPRLNVSILAVRHSHDNEVIYGDDLTLNVSENDKFIFFKNDSKIIHELVVNRLLKLDSMDFGDSLLLIKPIKRTDGAILVNFNGSNTHLHSYFRRNKLWRANSMKQLNHDINSLYNTFVDEFKKSNGTPEQSNRRNGTRNSITRNSATTITAEYLTPEMVNRFVSHTSIADSSIADSSIISPDLSHRVTRSGNIADLSSPIKTRAYRTPVRKPSISPVWESPAPFDPPLQYTFKDKHTFHINKNDFKTLYNNDWINDTIIDFCINYEVEQAVEKRMVKPHAIYAFNSFFFQKLTQGKTLHSDPPYYENVKRWLMKVDLGRYTYGIIPINEHMHWYGCIIKGVLQYVWNAKFKVDDDDDVDDDEAMKSLSSSTTTTTTTESSSEGSKGNIGSKIEVFIFDSLGHSHPSISKALKGFLIGYCEDKYSIKVSKDDIRLLNVKVPRQNNFNDCGIHVIYNIKRWLEDTTECEKLWHKSRAARSRRDADKFFNSSERNSMRRDIINLLLRLHEESNSSSTNNKNNNNDDNSERLDDKSTELVVNPKKPLELEHHEDDCVEFIGEVNGETSSLRNANDELNLVLDPSIFLLEDPDSVTFITPEYKNEDLAKSIGPVAVPLSFEKFINSVFAKKNMPVAKKTFQHCIKVYENATKEKGMYKAVADTIETLEVLAQLLPNKGALTAAAAQLFSITHKHSR
ncbi:uncharacterized protein KQ657_004025 [Scheffersomyces spartinae]|uniref:Ubiquitin-like protease family profile domain-containing protein n=1 Tax=Scheffersomyces spartinae TaxID=45513 RepID=A0A9P7VBN3_9ASCO|nr:uncharacterized protein KQ657_004025 [Scheffersomyces spartinae]KAG7194917.1 hypothetical protein KQ657_004025 [Scheffersomyces spartinae]